MRLIQQIPPLFAHLRQHAALARLEVAEESAEPKRRGVEERVEAGEGVARVGKRG